MIDDLRQKMFWDEISLVPLCTDTRVHSKSKREYDLIALWWISNPLSQPQVSSLRTESFEQCEIADAAQWTVAMKDSVVMCLCQEMWIKCYPFGENDWLLLLLFPGQLMIRRITISLHIYGVLCGSAAGTDKKTKASGSEVRWLWLWQWGQPVCCECDALPRWPWPRKVTDAFDGSLENVFKKDFWLPERLCSPTDV